MKRVLSFAAILVLLLLSSGCQLFRKSTGPNGQNIPPLSTLLPPGGIADTPTPTNPAPSAQAWIAFVKENNIWLIHPDGSDLTKITENPPAGQPSDPHIDLLKWSPDGVFLAYSYGAANVFSLHLYDLGTLKTELLVPRTGGAFDWSSTSREIIYDTPMDNPSAPGKNEGLWVVKLEDSTRRRVFQTAQYQDGPLGPQWSFDDKYVITSSTSGNVFDRTVADLSDRSMIHLINYIGRISMCEWAPDEEVMACVRNSSGTGQKPRLTVTILDAKGGILNDISLPKDWTAASAHWSPDGGEMALGYQQDESTHGIAILSLGTETLRMLVSGSSVDWSPDGKWLLVWGEGTDPNVASKISIVNASSGDSYPFSDGAAATWQPLQGPVERRVRSVPTEALYATAVSGPQLDLAITVKDTVKGDMLQIHTKDEDYEIGPLEKGVYAMGPNQKFFVYATYSGNVYATRFGDPDLHLIGRIRYFTTIRLGGDPRLLLIFFGRNPYTVQVIDQLTEEKQDFFIPRYISLSE